MAARGAAGAAVPAPPPLASVALAVLRKIVAGESAVLQGAGAPRHSRPPAIGWDATPPLSGIIPAVAEIPDEPPICETSIRPSNSKEWTRGHEVQRSKALSAVAQDGQAPPERAQRATHPRAQAPHRPSTVRGTCPRAPSFPSEAPAVPAPLFIGRQVLMASQAQDQPVNQPAKRPERGEPGSEGDKGLVTSHHLGEPGLT